MKRKSNYDQLDILIRTAVDCGLNVEILSDNHNVGQIRIEDYKTNCIMICRCHVPAFPADCIYLNRRDEFDRVGNCDYIINLPKDYTQAKDLFTRIFKFVGKNTSDNYLTKLSYK